MNEKPLVSVIMSCYREKISHFRLALESILNQTYDNLEILLVIDDPSNRGLITAAEGYAAIDSRIKLIKNQDNLGLTASLNKGIGLSTGQFICRMDSDDISECSRIDEQLRYLSDNDLDLVGCFLSVIDDDSNHLYDVTNIPTKSRSIARALWHNNCVPHPTWFGKAVVFDQKYRNVPCAEDYDFLLRAVRNGFAIGNVPKILFNYRLSEGSISRSNLYEQFLIACALRSGDGNDNTIDSINQFVAKRFDENHANRYSEANRLFNQSMTLFGDHKPFRSLLGLLRIPITSLSYCLNMWNMAIVVFIAALDNFSN